MVTIQGCNECEFTLSHQGSPLLKGVWGKKVTKFFFLLFITQNV